MTRIVGFFSQQFTNQRTAGEGGGHFFNSSLLLPTASLTLRYQCGDYCRELTSEHRQHPDLNWEPVVSEHKCLIILISWTMCVLQLLASELMTLTFLLMQKELIWSTLHEKCSYSEFSWSVFSRIRTEYGEIRLSECGKMRTRKTPNTDTFPTVAKSLDFYRELLSF